MDTLELEWFYIICEFLNNDYGLISCNPNITMEFIKANPDKPWNWHRISRNPNITMKMIKENTDKPWDWYHICTTVKFEKEKLEFIMKNEGFDLWVKLITMEVVCMKK